MFEKLLKKLSKKPGNNLPTENGDELVLPDAEEALAKIDQALREAESEKTADELRQDLINIMNNSSCGCG